MRRYSAAEAIGPAWEHATTLLWRNGRWATGLKIALVALLAEMSLGFNWNFWQHSNRSSSGPVSAHIAAGALIFIGFLFFLAGLVMFYIGSRLQLSLYDMVVRRSTWVSPSWAKYGSTVWRWIGLKLLLLCGLFAITIPATIVFGVHMVGLGMSGEKPDLGQIFGSMLPFLAVILTASLIFMFFYWAMRDFVMPSLALENTTLGFAFYRFRLFLAAEPGPIIGYLFLRLILSIVFGIVCYIAFLITLVLSAIPFGVIGLLIYMPVRHGGSGAQAGAIAFIVLLCIVFAAVALLIAIAFFGTLITFYFCWAAYFLGGRYPALGDLLEPPVIPPPFTPPPPLPINGDDEGDPGIPLNPQPVS